MDAIEEILTEALEDLPMSFAHPYGIYKNFITYIPSQNGKSSEKCVIMDFTRKMTFDKTEFVQRHTELCNLFASIQTWYHC